MNNNSLYKLGTVPFDLSVLRTLYPHCSNIVDKAKRLENSGDLIRLKRGMYVAQLHGAVLSRELIANHLYGPSYVSSSWALRHYGLTPERVYRIDSVTTKHTRDFENSLGVFHYQNCSPEYFPIGVTTKEEQNIHYLIASPEKALCDYICFNKVSLRSRRDVSTFLEEDLRFDTDILPELDLEIISRCAETGRSGGALSMLLNYLQHERRVWTFGKVESAFLKDNTDVYNLSFQAEKSIKIKIEVDTIPPLAFSTEQKLIMLPHTFSARCFTLPDLYASKMHALAFRQWKSRVKGRDWYDFEWYVRYNVPLDFEHLRVRAEEFNGLSLTRETFMNILRERIASTDIEQVKADVLPYLRNPRELDFWSNEYFLMLAERIRFA